MYNIEELSKAANENDSIAQNELGICYLTGHDVPKDEKQAVLLFRLAAEKGLVEAQHNLGCCYALGQGVKKNLKLAVDLFSIGAFQGNDEAIFAIEDLCKNKTIEKYCKDKGYYFSPNIVLAYFDILGFSNFVNSNQTHKVVQLYNKLIDIINRSPSDVTYVPHPVSADCKQNYYVAGVVGDIHTFYSSDSFLIWMRVNQKIHKRNPYVPYWLRTAFYDKYPLLIETDKEPIFYSNNIYYHAFLEVCMDFFCEALKQGIALRGCISTGAAYFDEKNKIYLGKPLVEAVRAESARQYIGIDFGRSFMKFHPLFNKYFIPNIINVRKNEEFSSTFSVDWARHWRKNYKDDNCVDKIIDMRSKNEEFSIYYDNTIKFYEFSRNNENWSTEVNCEKFKNIDDYIQQAKWWLIRNSEK